MNVQFQREYAILNRKTPVKVITTAILARDMDVALTSVVTIKESVNY